MGWVYLIANGWRDSSTILYKQGKQVVLGVEISLGKVEGLYSKVGLQILTLIGNLGWRDLSSD